MRVENLLEIAAKQLSFSDTPQLDAQVLMAHVLDKPRAWVMAHPEIELTTEQKNRLDDSLARLKRGESFPYILGKWEFFGNEFEVTKDVLIPRPETELLVEKAIAHLQSSALPEQSRIADIGTGSGVIAISIALHVPDARIVATDISSAALDVAKRNALKHNVQHRIEFIECDILPPQSQIDLLCANLPYIPTDTLHQLPIYGREPTIALDGGADGLDSYRRLFRIAPQYLSPRGVMLIEIEASQGASAVTLARDSFGNAVIQLHQDLTGRDRLIEIALP